MAPKQKTAEVAKQPTTYAAAPKKKKSKAAAAAAATTAAATTPGPKKKRISALPVVVVPESAVATPDVFELRPRIALADERYRGGVMGLLMLGVESVPGAIIDERALRLAQHTFVGAATAGAAVAASSPSSNTPLLFLPAFEAARKLYHDPRELASAVGDAVSVCTLRPGPQSSLPEYLMRREDARRKLGRSAPHDDVRRQLAALAQRFEAPPPLDVDGVDAGAVGRAMAPVDSADAVSWCALSGSLALAAKRAPPIAVLRRLVAQEEPPVSVPAGRAVVVFGRRAWDRAMRTSSMPAFVRVDVAARRRFALSLRPGQEVDLHVSAPLLRPPSQDAVPIPRTFKGVVVVGAAGTSFRLLNGWKNAMDGTDVVAATYAQAVGGGDADDVAVSKTRLMRDAGCPALILEGEDGDDDDDDDFAVVGQPTAAEAMVALCSDAGSVREVLLSTGASSVDRRYADLVHLVQANVLAAEQAHDPPPVAVAVTFDVDAGAPSFIDAMMAFVSPATEEIVGGGAVEVAARRPRKPHAAAVAAPSCDLPSLPGETDRSLRDWMRGGVAVEVEVACAQGHLRTAGPVLKADATGLLVYDHIRTVDPSSTCRSAAAERLRAAEAAASDDVDDDDDHIRTVGVGSALAAYASVLARLRSPVPPSVPPAFLRRQREQNDHRVAAEDDAELEQSIVLGMADATHYRAMRDAYRARDEDAVLQLAAKKDPNNSNRKLLGEVAAMLGLSPPLGVAEERAVIDGLEYHMPSGEGEQARLLRRRIAEVRRRRVELMGKADRNGKSYDAVERKLLDRLRADAAPHMLAETVTTLCAVLSVVVLSVSPERVASAPSAALASCLASTMQRGGRRPARHQNKRNVGMTSLLACAAAGVLSGRLAPPAPSEVDLGPAIAGAERAVRAEMPSLEKNAARRRLGGVAGRGGPSLAWPHFRPLLAQQQQPSAGGRARRPDGRLGSAHLLLPALWEHVNGAHGARLHVPAAASAPSSASGGYVGARSATACCAFAVAEPGEDVRDATTRWGALAESSTDIARALVADRQLDDAAGSAADVGIQPASAPQALEQALADPQVPPADREVLVVPAGALFEPTPLPRAPAARPRGGTERFELFVERLGSEVATELVPQPASEAALSAETRSRFTALAVKTLRIDAAEADDVLAVITSVEDGDGERIASAFLRAELAPSLSRLATSARLTAALAADRDLAPVAAAIAQHATPAFAVAVRERLRALAAACGAAAPFPEFAADTAVFAMWALSRAGEDLGPRVEEAVVRASSVMFARLTARVDLNRRDRYDLELVALQQKMEDARARARKEGEQLSAEQRELLRERRLVFRADVAAAGDGGGDGADAGGATAASPGWGEGDAANVDDDGGGGGDGIIDARGMYS